MERTKTMIVMEIILIVTIILFSYFFYKLMQLENKEYEMPPPRDIKKYLYEDYNPSYLYNNELDFFFIYEHPSAYPC